MTVGDGALYIGAQHNYPSELIDDVTQNGGSLTKKGILFNVLR